MDFSFEVVRLWRRPVARILEGGLGTLPLAPLCRLPRGMPLRQALASVIRRVEERLTAEASREDAAKLLTAVYVLTGLRVRQAVVEELFRGVQTMRESSTYRAILAEGRIEGVRKTLLQLARKRFGRPTKGITAALTAISDPDRLDRMTDRLLTVSSWQELLDTQ
jgi:hypothetical protein